jgi:DNA-binding MarR family transcriptional regulator
MDPIRSTPAWVRPGGPPLGFLLSAIGFGTAGGFRAALEPLGLHPQLFAVLRAVAADQGISQQSCGTTLHVAPSRMVALVDELEALGYLERRANPADRRARALFVTPAGEKAVRRAYEAARRYEAVLLAGLGDEEIAALRTTLRRIGDNLGLEPGTHPGMKMTPE